MNSWNLRLDLDRDFVWRLLLVFCTMSLILMMSDLAFASADSTNDVVGQTLCRLVRNLTGGIARGIATLAIFAVGIGLFLGKINWGIAAAPAGGVGIIFAAPQLVAFLSGVDGYSSCPTS